MKMFAAAAVAAVTIAAAESASAATTTITFDTNDITGGGVLDPAAGGSIVSGALYVPSYYPMPAPTWGQLFFEPYSGRIYTLRSFDVRAVVDTVLTLGAKPGVFDEGKYVFNLTGGEWTHIVQDYTTREVSSSQGDWRAIGGFYIDNIVFDYVEGPMEPGGVPEPSTWAMMITGFGLAGAALRRRRSPTVAA